MPFPTNRLKATNPPGKEAAVRPLRQPEPPLTHPPLLGPPHACPTTTTPDHRTCTTAHLPPPSPSFISCCCSSSSFFSFHSCFSRSPSFPSSPSYYSLSYVLSCFSSSLCLLPHFYTSFPPPPLFSFMMLPSLPTPSPYPAVLLPPLTLPSLSPSIPYFSPSPLFSCNLPLGLFPFHLYGNQVINSHWELGGVKLFCRQDSRPLIEAVTK